MNEREVTALVDALHRDRLSEAGLQAVLAAAVGAYSRRVQQAALDGLPRPAPFPDRSAVTATDVALTAKRMLAQLEIAPFELAIVPE